MKHSRFAFTTSSLMALCLLLLGCGEETPRSRSNAGPSTSDARTSSAADGAGALADATANPRSGADAGVIPEDALAGDYITIIRPAAGASWSVGSKQNIVWETNLEDVVLEYSTDDGATWQTIDPSVDIQSKQWLDYLWTIPDAPTTQAKIRIKGYFGEVPTESETFSITK